jgi:hypothetical protein
MAAGIGQRRSTITSFRASQPTLDLARETASAASDQNVVDAGPLGYDLLRDAQELLALVAALEQPPQRLRRVLEARAFGIVPLIEQDAVDKQSHRRSPNAYGFLASSEKAPPPKATNASEPPTIAMFFMKC